MQKNKIHFEMANLGKVSNWSIFDTNSFGTAWTSWYLHRRFEFSWKAQNETDRIEKKEVITASVNW